MKVTFWKGWKHFYTGADGFNQCSFDVGMTFFPCNIFLFAYILIYSYGSISIEIDIVAASWKKNIRSKSHLVYFSLSLPLIKQLINRWINACLFVWLFVFIVDLEKGCTFWPMLVRHGHWAMPYLLWHRASIYNGHLQGRFHYAFGNGIVTTML